MLLPTDKVQAQPFLCISLHPLEDPPKSLRTIHVSPKVRCNQSKGRSGKRNTFLKLAPSPISMEMIVKSDKTGGAIFTMRTGRTWQMAGYESLLVRDCVWVLTDFMTECVVRNSRLEQSAWGNCTVFCLLKGSICLFFFLCMSQPNQRYEVVYGISRNILNSWSTMENSGSANYLTTTEKWLCFPGQSFKW